MPRTSTSREPGTFHWQDDPNFRGPTNAPQQAPQAQQTAQTRTGSAVGAAANVMSAAQQLRGGTAGKQGGGLIKKIAPAVADGMGTIAGKVDSDIGNQIQSRAAGMRLRQDQAAAKDAAGAYVAAAESASDPAEAQTYRDAAANISKGANLDVPSGAEGGSTLAGTIAEGASKLLPVAGVSALGQFADGGEIKAQGEEFSRAWHAQNDTEQPAQTIRRFPRRAKKRRVG